MALTPGGRFAIVTEPFAQPAATDTQFSDIKPGRSLSVVDLSDPARPTVVQTVAAPSDPAAVHVHPSGDLVAVTLPGMARIALYPLKQGQLGEPSLQELGHNLAADAGPLDLQWSPDGQFLAAVFTTAERVAFYRYTEGRLVPWGDALRTGPLPGRGLWTPDGRHFIVTVIGATPDMAQASYAANSSLFAVFAVDRDEQPNSVPRRANERRAGYQSQPVQHARTALVPGGLGYVENFALSPDGRWLVGLNMAASWLPREHPGRTKHSELTLFEFDAANGRLESRGTLALPGVVLPQGITFDAAGRHLAITSFQHDDRAGGTLRFVRLDTTGRPRLVAVGAPTPLPRGVHAVLRISEARQEQR